MNEAALEADGDGFGTVCGVELLEDVEHVDLYGGLGPPEGNRDLFVALPLRHVGQDFQLAIGQVDSGCELSEALGYGRGKHAPAPVYRPDRVGDLVTDHVLEEIASRARLQRPMDVAVAVPGRQRNDA